MEFEEKGFAIASWRNVIVSLWRGAVTVPRLDELVRRERVLEARSPRGIVPFTIVADVPTEMLKVGEAERKRASEIASEMGPFTIAHPNVVLGGGFWSATVRGVMSAAYLVSRAKYPTKAFDTIADACAWVAPLIGKAGETEPPVLEMSAELEAVVRGER
jgi:hypothetical protein